MKAAVHQRLLHHLTPRKLLTYTLYFLVPFALLHYYLLDPYPSSISAATPPPSSGAPRHHQIHSTESTPYQLPPPPQPRCNYSAGTWIPDDRGPLYNGTSCQTIKENQNCMKHGRPDTGYLYWRWKPNGCELPRFDPVSFLELIRDRHLVFVGDSLARNQAESLMCLLASGSDQPELVYRDGAENRHRRWIFGSHNATVSIYWSPFLVKRIEKSEKDGVRHNRVFLDSFDERWIKDFDSMDVIVFSLGHWFLIPGIYYENERVIGCHACSPEFNHTEIGFFDVFRKAVRRTLDEVRRRHYAAPGGVTRNRLVAVTTFTQAHFEGEWDKAGACAKTKPYSDGEVELEYTAGELQRTVLDTLESFKQRDSNGLRFEAVDVTRLAMLRPDGHPGPYMYPDPFGDGKVRDRVQNDCVHWCMPGPVDTFNEILWQLIAQPGLFS